MRKERVKCLKHDWQFPRTYSGTNRTRNNPRGIYTLLKCLNCGGIGRLVWGGRSNIIRIK